jgi:hypothetical protein
MEHLLCMCLPCGFVGLSLVRRVAVLNVFAGAEVCCMAVGHHGRDSVITTACTPDDGRFGKQHF